MATAVARRTASTVLAGFVLVPTALLIASPAYAEEAPVAEVEIGEPAYEEAVPDPVTGLYPGQYVPATESSPATPGWISGETLQAGTGVKPAAKPVTVKPVKPAAVAPTRTVRTRRPAAPSSTAGSSVDTQFQPTALAFTGPGRLAVQLSVGGGLVLVGGFVMVAARPRTGF